MEGLSRWHSLKWLGAALYAGAVRPAAVKKSSGAPQSLWACHTAEIDGYVIEGHVPPAAIKRLLREKPLALGLGVPGMPIGSPGMETQEADVASSVYDVILFDAVGQKSYGRYRGDAAL